jgi:hypothetical protein
MFAQAMTQFVNAFDGLPLPPLDLTDGWHNITPEIAENLLRRNPANRKPSFGTVVYYARLMVIGAWKKTGQPIIVDANQMLLDAQHRLLASYFSGASFPSYVVTGVPAEQNLFAFIDNCKARTAKDALQTAGHNGTAAAIAAAVRIALQYDAGAFSVVRKGKVDRPSPAEVLSYAMANPRLEEAAHLQTGEYKSATALIDHKGISVFAAWQILENYTEDRLDEFMSQLGSTEVLEENSAIAALRKKLTDDQVADEPMPGYHKLGYITKAFNAWRLDQPMRRLNLKTDELWPQFVDQQVDADAA